MENNNRIWAKYMPSYVQYILGVMQGKYTKEIGLYVGYIDNIN